MKHTDVIGIIRDHYESEGKIMSLAERTEIRAQRDLRRNYLALLLCAVKTSYTVDSAIRLACGPIALESPRRSAGQWTNEELRRIDDLHNSGLTWREVGLEMGFPASSLHGVWMRQQKKKGEKSL